MNESSSQQALDVRVAVIVVNWNGWRHTLACIAALRRSAGVNWHAYVVDNASTDESLAQLSGLGDGVTLIESPINGGWSGGNNLGVEAALAARHEFVFLLNNDAIVLPETLNELVRAHETMSGPLPILGCVQLSDDGSKQTFVCTDIDPRTGIPVWIDPAQYAERLREPLIPTAFSSGAALFASRALFEQVGLFDDRFYLNYDETDWCFRAAAQGHPCFTVRAAVVKHTGNASIGGHESPMQYYFLTRNQLLFAEKHCTRMQWVRNLRKSLGLVKWLSTADGHGGRARKILHPSPVMRAVQSALRDYALRRFGDCPPEIRKLNRVAA